MRAAEAVVGGREEDQIGVNLGIIARLCVPGGYILRVMKRLWTWGPCSSGCTFPMHK